MKIEAQGAFRRVAMALAAAVITSATFGAINSAIAQPAASSVAAVTAPASYVVKTPLELARLQSQP